MALHVFELRQPLRALLLGAPIAVSACSGLGDHHPMFAERYRDQKRLAVENASIDGLRSALSSLETWHRSHNTRVASRLAPGLSGDDIRNRTARLGFLPAELVALYEWHNGTTGGCDDLQGPPLLAYHCFFSLDEALAAQEREARWYRFPKRWFPVLYFQEEYFYVVLDDTGDVALPIFHRLLESDDTVAFTNLRRLVETYVEAANRGFWHPDKYDNLGSQEVERIRRERNPNTDPPWRP